jgi:hypothetical protein
LRRAVLGIVVTLVSVGCGRATGVVDPAPLDTGISIRTTPSPYSEVTLGPVSALVPEGWRAEPAGSRVGVRGGFVASPRPQAWRRMDGSTSGMAATWVDATRVGVPSDFYYLAATGPLLSRLSNSHGCRADRTEILADNRPAFAHGAPGSPGDYVARAEGTCHVHGHPTRWAYFVAAPGYGPVHRLGIPSSGLYVVVAVMPDSAQAASQLRRLIAHTSFAGASVDDLAAATRPQVG